MCQGGAVTDNRAELETVLRHIAWLDGEDADIAETIEALAACGDTTLVPALNEALERFLDEGNFYGRDVIAQILAGIEWEAALPTLLRAAARDLGDDQDTLCSVITDLLDGDPMLCRPVVLALADEQPPAQRKIALWALGHVVEVADLERLAAAAAVVAGVLRGRPDLAGVLPLTGHPADFSTRWTTSNSSRPAPEATGRARSPACAARPDPADQAWKSSSVSQRV
jgi:hypothetical protein